MNKGNKIKYIVALILFSKFQIGISQNLVPNGSFDNKFRNKLSSKPWRYTNTVDFISIGEHFKLPSNIKDWTFPKPRTGKSYVGIRIYSNYREFIQIRLKEKLEKGQLYLCEMYVQTSENTNIYLRSIGMNISYTKPSYTNKINLYRHRSQIEYYNPIGIRKNNEEKGWVKIRGFYRAIGGEKYLSIGHFGVNFFKDEVKLKNIFSIFNFNFFAYYFIDDISIVKVDNNGIPIYMKTEIKDTILKKISKDSLELKQDSTFFKTSDSLIEQFVKENYIYKIEKENKLILKNIDFDFGSFDLTYRSYNELELLLEYLHSNRNINIIIEGHTDNIGDAHVNKILSEKRAKTIYKYLIKNEINPSRIKYIGKGEEEPRYSNNTPIGRKKNRRVEIIKFSLKK